MPRGGKAVERIPPCKRKVAIPVFGQAVFVDADRTDRRQHAPGVIRRCPSLLELHKLIVYGCLCGDQTEGRQQRILHLDGLRAGVVGRPCHKFRFFRICYHALGLFFPVVAVSDEIAIRRLADQQAFFIGLRSGNSCEISEAAPQFAQRHMDVLVLQGKRAVIQRDRLYGSAGRPYVTRKSQRLRG